MPDLKPFWAVRVWWEEPDKCYFACYEANPGMSAYGGTPADALRELSNATELIQDDAKLMPPLHQMVWNHRPAQPDCESCTDWLGDDRKWPEPGEKKCDACAHKICTDPTHEGYAR